MSDFLYLVVWLDMKVTDNRKRTAENALFHDIPRTNENDF